jgi:hypothetical protein
LLKKLDTFPNFKLAAEETRHGFPVLFQRVYKGFIHESSACVGSYAGAGKVSLVDQIVTAISAHEWLKKLLRPSPIKKSIHASIKVF